MGLGGGAVDQMEFAGVVLDQGLEHPHFDRAPATAATEDEGDLQSASSIHHSVKS